MINKTHNNVVEFIYEFAKFLSGQYLFWANGKMYITKLGDNGYWCTSEATKDPNHKGFRYIWKSEIVVE